MQSARNLPLARMKHEAKALYEWLKKQCYCPRFFCNINTVLSHIVKKHSHFIHFTLFSDGLFRLWAGDTSRQYIRLCGFIHATYFM